jgi:DEAD/DEAH box helicase domain-containing protein
VAKLGAIYMHQGNTYLVKELDTDRKIVSVIAVNVDWTTRQRDFTYFQRSGRCC